MTASAPAAATWRRSSTEATPPEYCSSSLVILRTLARVRKMTRLELQYSGGVASVEDLRQVAAAGAEAVILGKALYEGKNAPAQAQGASGRSGWSRWGTCRSPAAR